jgi:hypothetical protein
MGALYEITINGERKPLIYAHDDEDAWEIANRWYNNPEQAKIKLSDEENEE